MQTHAKANFILGVAILSAIFPFSVTEAQPAQTQVSYVSVRDPREQAFSIEAPQGWKTTGGIFRYGSIDARFLIDTTSPDGKTNIRLGDATIPPYTTPGPMNRVRGPRIAPYATGEQFATKYGQARFGSMCQSVQVKGSRPMPAKYHPNGPQQVPGLKTTGGEAYFVCTEAGQQMFGHVYSETYEVGTAPGLASWYVVALGSYICPLDQAKAVGGILRHAADSIHLNPAWVRMQQGLVDQATQVLLGQAHATMRATEQMNAHQQQVMRGQQAENDNFNDIINGVSFTRDTVTGKEYTAPMGTGGTQWVNGNHTVVESAMQPGPGFNQLQNISH